MENIDLNNHKIVINQADKTGGGRVIYFSSDALEALLAWLRLPSAAVFKLHVFDV
jgi:hypothetical protein